MQSTPSAHVLHMPAAHTLPVPHAVPSDRSVAVAWHTGEPVLHAIAPALQGAAGSTHAAPASHTWQVPARHTCPAPHAVPAGLSVPVSAQSSWPDAHEVFVSLHALVPVHALPAVHAAQSPSKQTLSVPHAVPLAMSPGCASHTAEPVLHEIAATLHSEPATVQVSPSLHALHVPPTQKSLVPHAVPSSRLAAPGTQSGAPVAHDSTPALHSPCPSAQAPPAAQVMHAPALQTLSAPQVVPSGAFLPPEKHGSCDTTTKNEKCATCARSAVPCGAAPATSVHAPSGAAV